MSGLTLSGVTLNEAFDSATTSYTADVGHTEPSTTTVTATTNHDGATVVIKLGEVVKTGGTVDLGNGDTVITVEVTAAGGGTNTYTVTVTRHADADDDVAPLPIISSVECPDTPNPSVCDLDNELGKSEDSPVDGAVQHSRPLRRGRPAGLAGTWFRQQRHHRHQCHGVRLRERYERLLVLPLSGHADGGRRARP